MARVVLPLAAPLSTAAVEGQANPFGTADSALTWTPTGCAFQVLVIAFSVPSLVDPVLTITDDDPSYRWRVLDEVNEQTPGNPSTLHVCVWGAKAPYAPVSHTTTIDGLAGLFFSLRAIEWPFADATANVADVKDESSTGGSGASSLSCDLPSAPPVDDGVFLVGVKWPSGNLGFVGGATDMGINDQPVQGAYFQPHRAQYAYRLGEAGSTWGLDLLSGTLDSSILIALDIKATVPCIAPPDLSAGPRAVDGGFLPVNVVLARD